MNEVQDTCPGDVVTRCGYVALLGRPNAGKSTLLNHLIGQKAAIVSDKPQTTRYRILGIRSTPMSQMIFVDTPGIHRPGFRLNTRMMDTVYGTLREVDVVVHVVDASVSYGRGSEYAVDLMRTFRGPVLLALNKIDLINKGKVLPVIQSYSEMSVYEEIIPMSALSGDNLDRLLPLIEERLPQQPFLFPPEQWTDQTERTMVAEIIREKVLIHTRRELPYSTAVRMELFDESRRFSGEEVEDEGAQTDGRPPSFVHIAASIIVDKPGQKKIVVGRGGSMIKRIGTEARKELQRFLGVDKIYLELNVKVVPGWRDTDHLLDDLGVQ